MDRPREITLGSNNSAPVPPDGSSLSAPIPVILTQETIASNPSLPDIEAAVSNDSSSGVAPISLRGANMSTTSAPDSNQMRTPTSPSSRHGKPLVHVDSRGRRELTSPDKISSRLLQGTSASRRRLAKETTSATSRGSGHSRRSITPVPTRLLRSTEATLVHQALSPGRAKRCSEAEQEATKLRVRERVEEQKRKQAERDKEMRKRIQIRQEQQRERKQRMQEVLSRARGKRERLEQMERERVEKLKQKLAEKERKALQRKTAEKENHSERGPAPRTKPIHHRNFKPTIPVAPSFATDRRLKQKPPSARVPPPPPARNNDLFKQGLRASTPETRRISSGSGPTIPKGPRLTTSSRHGEKHVAVPIRDTNEPPAWERGLRSVSSPTPSERSNHSHSITIPKTPKFNESHKRLPPKSTAEKEKEMIDYYKAHPFKARPVRMNDLSPAPRPTKVDPPRPLTRPAPFHFLTDDRFGKSREDLDGKKEENVSFKARPMPNFSSVRNTPLTGKITSSNRAPTTTAPFHFHTDDRIGKSREDLGGKKEENVLFKARPMPNFASTRNSPLTGKVSPSKKHLTTPEPFNLRTDERASSSPPKTSPAKSNDSMFRARPMPKFDKHSPTIMQRNPSRKTPPQEPEGRFQFKARPMPDFGSKGPPATISFNATSQDSMQNVRDDASEQFQFHARPMPSFEETSIPVVARDPSKTRSPQRVRREEQQNDVVEIKPFRARQLPDFSKPSIPVKPRSPSSIVSSPRSRISPDRQLATSPPEQVQHFQARPLPKASGPSIPVRQKDPTKTRRSPPDSLKRDRPQSPPPQFHAKPAPKFLRPSIPVKQKDPSKLRSPDAVKKVGDTGMVVRAGRPLQNSGPSVTSSGSRTNGSVSLTPSEQAKAAVHRVAERRARKAQVRERMMGRKSASHSDARNSSLSYGGETSSSYTTGESTMDNTAALRSPVRPHETVRTTGSSASTGTETIMQNWGMANPTSSTSEGPSGATSATTGESLRLATNLWPSTPGRNQQILYQEQGIIVEDESMKRYHDTVRMAHEIERQADDELSFHGSVTSKEQGHKIAQMESIL